MDLSLIIPVYNEEKILEQSIQEVLHFFSPLPLAWELIVVNDGSTDATGEILAVMQQRDARVQSIHWPENRGKGAAVREGFLKSQGDFMLFFDIDLSTPLATFHDFWPRRDARTVLIGSRVATGASISRHQRLVREYAGRLSNVLVRMLLPIPFRDTQCGFKLYPGAFRTLLPKSQVNGAAFDIEWLLIAQRNGLDREEVPVTWTNRPDSRFTFVDYSRALAEVIEIFAHDKRGAYRSGPLS